MIDLSKVRADTPGCRERIHLNNAGAALMSSGVLAAQHEQLDLEGRLGGYEAAQATLDTFEAVYDSIAALIGADRAEIALVENATVAWNLAFQTIDLAPGDRILTAEAEYAANYIAYLHAARRHGAMVEVVPSDEHGQLDLSALAEMIDERVKLVSITHVPTNGGLVNPAEAIGAVTRTAGIPFLLDACQSVGQLDLDVEQIGCDFLTATGRKYLRGPRGTGFLYASRRILERTEPSMLDLHSASWVSTDRYEIRADARRYENWEFNHAAVHGLGRAVDEALDLGMPEIEARIVELAADLRGRLAAAELPVYDIGARRCGIVTTAVPGVDAAAAQSALFDRGINVSVSTPFSTRIDAERRALPDLLRLSVHYYNTTDELDTAVAALTAICA
jgi:selenocysteine lyase/cysteine desulfurase